MSSKTWHWASAVVFCGLVALVCSASTPGLTQDQDEAEPASPGFQEYLEGAQTAAPAAEESDYISLDVKDKDLNEVLKFISRRVGVNVIADSNVKESVTVTFDQIEWRNALRIIAEKTHCKIVEVSERLLRFTQPPSISMEFQEADIKVVLDLLAKQAGANIVMASDIQGKVSLSLRDVPWRDALNTLVKTAGYVLVKEDSTTESEILRVVRPESLKKQLETRHYRLKYVRPEEPYTATVSDIEKLARSSFGGQQAPEQGATGFSLEDALREVVSDDGGSLQYDKNTNTFIVKDIKPKLDEIEAIIRLVDVPPSLVHVEVKFIRTTNADIFEAGFKWDDPGTPERDGFVVNARGAAPGEFDGRTVTVNGNSVNLNEDPLNIFGGSYPFDIGRIDRPPFGIEDFQALGILDFTQTQVTLRLVKDDDRSRIVQEPTLTVVDNRPAVIFVGESVPYAVQKIQQDQNGNVTVAIDENEKSPQNVGFTLYLVPHVIPETDQIDLSVIPNVSALSGTTSDIIGFERFQFQSAGSETQAFIDLPRVTRQTVVTYLRVQNGHTAVIGGLQTERRREIETRIPFVSAIPILGELFKWRRRQANVESLIVLITPHILKSAQQEDTIFEKRLKQHNQSDYFYVPEVEEEVEEPLEESTEASPPEAGEN